MIPVEKYPRIHKDASVYDAIITLKNAQETDLPNSFRFRAVLVLDDNHKVIGKVGHFTFLKALEPKYKLVFDMDKLSRANLSSNFIDSMMDHFDLWDDTIDMCHIAKSTKVSEVMRSIDEHIEDDSTIGEAIHKILMWQSLSVLVTHGKEIVGILRLSDIYAEVENYILNCDD